MKKTMAVLVSAMMGISLASCGPANDSSKSSDSAKATTESQTVNSLPAIDKAEIVAEYTDFADGYMFRLDVEGSLKYWTAEVTLTDCGEQSKITVSTRDYDRNSRYITGGSTITDVSAVVTPYDADGNAGKPVNVKWDHDRLEKSTEENTIEFSDPATETSSEDLSVDAIVGDWYYENRDAGSEGYVGIPKGRVTVSADGTYSYNNGSSISDGKVKLNYEEYFDGSKVPYYAFYNEDGDLWIGCYVSETEKDVLNIGNSGESRLVRDTGNTSGGTDDKPVPNDYGFYEYNEPPHEGTACIMAKDIEGEWLHGQYVLVVKDCDMYSGAFEDHNEGGDYLGCVRLEYKPEANDTKQLWYNLYTNDGGLFKSFRATGDIPLNSITDEMPHGIEHTRVIRENDN